MSVATPNIITVLTHEFASLRKRIELLENTVDSMEEAWPCDEEKKEKKLLPFPKKAPRKSKPAADAGQIKEVTSLTPFVPNVDLKHGVPPAELPLSFTIPKRFTVFPETEVKAVKKMIAAKAKEAKSMIAGSPGVWGAMTRIPRKTDSLAILIGDIKLVLKSGADDWTVTPDRKSLEANPNIMELVPVPESSFKEIIEGIERKTGVHWITEKQLLVHLKAPKSTSPKPIKRSAAVMNGAVLGTRPAATPLMNGNAVVRPRPAKKPKLAVIPEAEPGAGAEAAESKENNAA